MQSPFQIFRKHQKVMTVVLIGMAMVAFVLLDPLRQASVSPTLRVLMLAVLVGAAFWVVGMQGGKGKQTEYGVGGLVVGTLAGLALMFFNKPIAAVETSAGNLSKEDLRTMVEKRRTAVSFMHRAYVSGVSQPKQPKFQGGDMQLFSRWFDQRRQWQRNQIDAAFGYPENAQIGEVDAVLKFLLLQEAKKRGIKVNNDAVRAYIDKWVPSLTRQAYNSILSDLKVSHSEMTAILREEIAARIIFDFLIRPDLSLPSPAEYWDLYRKLHVRQTLNFVKIPVAPFASDLKEPDDAELKKLFEKYKNNQPTATLSPDPAFRLPHRIQIAYFEADYPAVEKDVLKKLDSDFLTGKEIAAAIKQIDADVADVEKRIKDKDIEKKSQYEKARLNALQEMLRELLQSKSVNRLEFEIVKHYEDNKTRDYFNTDWVNTVTDDDPFVKMKKDPVAAVKPDGAGGFQPLHLPATQPPPPAPPADPPFQALSTVRESIRQTILKQHVVTEIRKRLQQAAVKMEKHADQYLKSQDDASAVFAANEVSEELNKFADQIGLVYVVPPGFISGLEFQDSTDYPMSTADEVFSLTDMMAQPRRSVIAILFSRGAQSARRQQDLYRVIKAVVSPPRNRFAKPEPNQKAYVLWKTYQLNPEVPKFTDSGMRERVLEAWRNINGRKPAEARATEIAEMVKTAGKPIEDVIAKLTVTDKPDGDPLDAVEMTEKLTWLTETQDNSSVPRLGIPAGIWPMKVGKDVNAGDEFRRIIFDELKDGEVGVAPNHDKSAYYVVRVTERFPETLEGREDLMKKFLKANPTTSDAFSSLNGPGSELNARLRRELVRQLNLKYQVQWNTGTDGP